MRGISKTFCRGRIDRQHHGIYWITTTRSTEACLSSFANNGRFWRWICFSARSQQRMRLMSSGIRHFSRSVSENTNPTPPGSDLRATKSDEHGPNSETGRAENLPSLPSKEEGAMSRRLEQMTDDSLTTGGASARRAVADAGFDEDLRRRLEERILSSSSARAEHPEAFATMDLPESAGRAARDIAGAKAWTGEEALSDTALRMLTDAHKPLRGRGGSRQPIRIAPMRMKSKQPSIGKRIADAREQASKYSDRKEAGMDDEDKAEFLKELHARYQPGARNMPATISGLASLANERIEEAIARGQFKNLPRGKTLERDYNASSQFLDTTEYLLNRMIARQDIVPPWIEKQQEVASAARVFRARLRNDWKRHAARMISSAGGSLEEKMQRAREYAAAEIEATRAVPTNVSIIASEDQSQLSLSGQENSDLNQDQKSASGTSANNEEPVAMGDSSIQPLRKRYPFRDPEWQATELSFQTASITNLNNLTRSYNLMAPELAKKPYYNLDRELKACFAEVAPQIADEIRERALTPNLRNKSVTGSSGSSVFQRFEKDKALVHDEDIRKKGYGWREFWNDMWRSGGTMPR